MLILQWRELKFINKIMVTQLAGAETEIKP